MDTPTPPATTTASEPRKKSPLRTVVLWIVALVVLGFVYFNFGVFTIQPIGALPDGITLVILRNAQRPFFDSPDRLCLDIQKGVSLLCRAAAMTAVDPSQIVLRLPYQEWAYLISTNGSTFER